jgi:RNA polymerase II subunit A C-terminal domain phosphatase SSU72
MDGDKKKIACVCLSNQNRSMEAHAHMRRRNVENVYSFGTGNKVKLPGKTPEESNVFDFGTPYSTMAETLKNKDPLCAFFL